MIKRNKQDPGQEALFVSGPQGDYIYPRNFYEPAHPPEAQATPDGPSVNIMERNLHLQNALDLLGRMSQRTGLQTASETPSSRKKIEDRYGSSTDRVVEGAINNKGQMMKETKNEFARAYGMYAMIDSGLVSREGAQAMTRDAFEGRNEGSEKESFIREYADSHNRQKRDTERKKLARAARIMQGKKR